ncbi:MAG: hypothetical protein WAW80_02630 [Candidatus Saccharimonadales bacterium]
MKNSKQAIFTKQMTRREFIQLGGLSVLSIFGLANFFSFWMSNPQQSIRSDLPTTQTSGRGFGSSKFGV